MDEKLNLYLYQKVDENTDFPIYETNINVYDDSLRKKITEISEDQITELTYKYLHKIPLEARAKTHVYSKVDNLEDNLEKDTKMVMEYKYDNPNTKQCEEHLLELVEIINHLLTTVNQLTKQNVQLDTVLQHVASSEPELVKKNYTNNINLYHEFSISEGTEGINKAKTNLGKLLDNNMKQFKKKFNINQDSTLKTHFGIDLDSADKVSDQLENFLKEDIKFLKALTDVQKVIIDKSGEEFFKKINRLNLIKDLE